MLSYDVPVNADIWVGAVTTLAGAVLGGAISYLLSRQQISEARIQRAEEAQRAQDSRSEERRFTAYSDFLSQARRYRTAIRPYRLDSAPGLTVQEIDAYAAAADAAGSLVFLVSQSLGTHEACRKVLRSIGETLAVIHELSMDLEAGPWEELNNDVAGSLREFQNAARAELGAGEARLS
jgi:hypothetical protein